MMSQPAPERDATHVLTLEEISNLTTDSGKPAETLMNVVALIAKRFQTDVCSAYLLEPDRANLVLAATVGLRPQCIGTLRLGLHEGLTGLVAEELAPVAVGQVKNHPRFKFFREAGEEAYQSFLGVPLIERGVLQGVLVVQTLESREFRPDEIRMLAEAAAQVANQKVAATRENADRKIAEAEQTARNAQTVSDVLAAPDLVRFNVTSGATTPRAYAQMLWSRSRGLVFSGSRVPAAPAGTTYQAWLLTATEPVSAGLFVPDQAGRVMMVNQDPPRVPRPVTGVAVTLEPTGGRPAPSGPTLLARAP